MDEHDLNRPREGDLAQYNGELWVFFGGCWVLLSEGMNMVFEVRILEADDVRPR